MKVQQSERVKENREDEELIMKVFCIIDDSAKTKWSEA